MTKKDVFCSISSKEVKYYGIACLIIVLFNSEYTTTIAMKAAPELSSSFMLLIQLTNAIFLCFFLFALVGLYYKNKNHVWWFLPIFVLAFVWPSLIGKHKIVYNIYAFFSALKISGLAFILFFYFDWFNKQKQTKELEKQNLHSELALLKNQINPHFLFNTLNNIDSLIKKNPDYASKSIIELSGIMRYMIYETNVDRVPLQKELDYIDNYLCLQKLQYFNDELVEYTVIGDPKDKEIAPMLFIPFVENAFKHCTDKEKKHAIQFSFLLESNKITFDAINIADKTQDLSKDKSGGIGLETVKRRLEFLYPNRYSLQISEKNDLFCISLMIATDD